MSRIRFNLIVVLMSFAVAGLIFLQAYWINQDLQFKQQQFDQNVKQALVDIVDKVEQNENMRIVAGNLLSETDTSWVEQEWIDTTINSIIDRYVPTPPTPPQPPAPPELTREVQKNMEGYLQRIKNSGNADLMNPHSLMPLDSIINIKIEKDVQQKEVIAIKMRRSGNGQDSLYEMTEQRVKSKLRKLNNMMQRITFQVIDPVHDPLKRIQPKELDSIIFKELYVRDLPLSYNFGIKSGSTDSLLFIKSSSETNELLCSNYTANLFPNDVFNRNDILLLGMSSKISFILASMWPMLLSSALFSLIIIAGFTYSLLTILKQKRLADIKNDFINNMTHEFKTPIATIAIANEAIKDPRIHTNDERLNYYTSVIRDENERMLKQVENVLQMAQIDKGELKVRKEDINMHEVINRAVGKVMLQVEQRDGKIETNLSATEFMVHGDGNHLLNSIINLLDNANKYSPGAPSIKITSRNDGSDIIISVEDNGIGMSKETQKKVFETFFRAQTGNVHDVKGFGLGLSYVKAIIESHHGEINVSSVINKGSTFSIILPTLN